MALKSPARTVALKSPFLSALEVDDDDVEEELLLPLELLEPLLDLEHFWVLPRLLLLLVVDEVDDVDLPRLDDLDEGQLSSSIGLIVGLEVGKYVGTLEVGM